MTEEQIEQMHLFDLEAFNSRRRFCEHTQQFPELPENIDEEDGFSPIFDKFIDELSVGMNTSDFQDRYWWIEEIENELLAKKLKTLPIDDVELITQYVFEQRTQVVNTPPENRRSDRRSPTARPQKSYTPAVGQTPCV